MKFVKHAMKKCLDTKNDVSSFVADTFNTHCFRTSEPSCIDVQQTNKRPNAKAMQTPHTI